MCVQVLFSYTHTHTHTHTHRLRKACCVAPSSYTSPLFPVHGRRLHSVSRAPTHGAQLTPAADATLGHLVDLGVENQVEPTTASKETHYSVKRDLLQCELVKSPVAQVERQAAQPSTRRPDRELTKDERANRALQRSEARARRQQMLERLGQTVERASGQSKGLQ